LSGEKHGLTQRDKTFFPPHYYVIRVIMRFLFNSFLALMSLGLLGIIAAVGVFAFVIGYYGQDLPDYKQLSQYEPDVMTRIYAANGDLLAEYAREKRVFVPVEKIPPIVKQAFLSAEDQNFYDHFGIDPFAVARAVVINLRNVGSDRRLVGASTITQQVAKNFLLTNEVSFERKIKEAILALRLEKILTKDELLELYLNEIFLGQRAYGVAAAAQIYFNKSLEELTIEEAAYLAALPKAPNNYHPVNKYDEAVERRNWVIGRMREDGYIEESQAELAQAKPLGTVKRRFADTVDADFFAEEVRREVKEKYGEDSLYQGGLTVRSSLNPEMQNYAVEALRDGLMEYDKRHGWRGPVAKLNDITSWQSGLNNIQKQEGQLETWKMAVVLDADNSQAKIGYKDGTTGTLPLEGVKWARECQQDCYALGPEIERVGQVVTEGDVIFVEQTEEGLVLRQVPKVQGAIVAIDPHTGRVLAMQGGWTQSSSSFNRATQAKRQPGSAFKPFVYLAALDSGFTPSTLVLDGPFTIEQSPGKFWRPTNYSNKYYGPSTLRLGLEKSRNLMTVRLAHNIGMDKVVDYAERFGVADDMKRYLSYSLGAAETTLLRLTAAYGMFVNGGKKVDPTFIDRIQDRNGKTVFSYDGRPCMNCGDLIRWDGQSTPDIPDGREQIADEKTTYQIVSMLEGVVERGTAARLKSLGRPLAGKTGTTNESKDTWFIGFSPDLVVGVFVGFDEPKSLGKRETGSSVAAPIWGDFMEMALADKPPAPFRVPSGIKNVRVNAKTGRLAQAGDTDVIWEAFITGTEPQDDYYVLDTAVIDGDNLLDPSADPYGYGQFGYGDYASTPTSVYDDGSVEVYSMPPEGEGSDSFSYFSRRQQNGNNGDPQYQDNNEGSYQAPPRGERRPPAQQRPQQTDPSLSGTGGLY
jgi:penicillin-binding protein 1A